MNSVKKLIIGAATLVGLSGAAMADPYGYTHYLNKGESIENQALDLRALANSVQIQRFQNPRTGRNYTAVIQTGRNNGLGLAQSGNVNSARVIQRGNNTNVHVNQKGDFNNSAVLIFGH